MRIQARRYQGVARLLLIMLPPLALIGCNSVPVNPPAAEKSASPAPATKSSSSTLPVLPRAGSGRGGYYMDDGPGDSPPEGLLDTPDAEPRIEPYYARNSRPYVVFGKTYTPMTDERPFKQRGVGSWYGKKFHGQKTASGELYDMYKMTAAHPTLPIPSYVRVTNLSNGKQVIVRVNDRGPFHSGRIIDLSYTAALKLGYLSNGSSQLEVERLLPDDIARMNSGAAAKRVADMPVSQTNVKPVTSQAGAVVEATPVALTNDTSTFALPETVLATADAAMGIVPAVVTSTGSIGAGARPGSAYYLQLGAYAQATNADSVRARLMQQTAGKLETIEIVGSGPVHRLFGGPFATRAEAAAVAVQLQESGMKPVIVQR
ncbi:septal ring lytic transglycosylase RlpA family protein [Noviherbaspirillum saxi]|uniref:Endolytic peptidoglycan transglycosylase RlpA n=1 Tax=Noviherbaspirillum saxi TaxID=2320863 RepID=A0A3A3FUQ0_9BURK|nr:septal ring lytic transglycosylase RlpA family protein [Noviherbaspirillum saxi]